MGVCPWECSCDSPPNGIGFQESLCALIHVVFLAHQLELHLTVCNRHLIVMNQTEVLFFLYEKMSGGRQSRTDVKST